MNLCWMKFVIVTCVGGLLGVNIWWVEIIQKCFYLGYGVVKNLRGFPKIFVWKINYGDMRKFWDFFLWGHL